VGEPDGVDAGVGVGDGAPEAVDEGAGVGDGEPEAVDDGAGVGDGIPDWVGVGAGVGVVFLLKCDDTDALTNASALTVSGFEVSFTPSAIQWLNAHPSAACAVS
jgi:hypothetical protein